MSRPRHLFQHGSRSDGDSLDVLGEQDRLLQRIIDQWAATVPSDNRDVTTAWDHGTVGKLLLEHGAVRAAAIDDITGVLTRHDCQQLADALARHRTEIRRLLDRLDESARGVAPVALADDDDFAAAADELLDLLHGDLRADAAELSAKVAAALGDHRRELAGAKQVRKHAPTHPAVERRWYHRLPGVTRAQAGYDRLRGFPWAESGPIADEALAERYDPET